MPKFHVHLQMKPASMFGLPDGDLVVRPEPAITLGFRTPPNADVAPLPRTVPLYRTAPITMKWDSKWSATGISCALEDDICELVFDAPDIGTAKEIAQSFGSRLIALLTFAFGPSFGDAFHCATIAVRQAGAPYFGNSREMQYKCVRYDQGVMASSLKYAAQSIRHIDDILDKALAYYYVAVLLEKEVPRVPVKDPPPSMTVVLTADVFLNFFKAASVICGDPKDKDVQSRFKKFGLRADFYARYSSLFVLRNDSDVAHRSDDWVRIKQAASRYLEIKKVAHEAIIAYVDFLAKLPE